MSEETNREQFLAGLLSNISFQKFVMKPLELQRKNYLREVTDIKASETERAFSAGALKACEFLDSLFILATKKFEQRAKK